MLNKLINYNDLKLKVTEEPNNYTDKMLISLYSVSFFILYYG